MEVSSGEVVSGSVGVLPVALVQSTHFDERPWVECTACEDSACTPDL